MSSFFHKHGHLLILCVIFGLLVAVALILTIYTSASYKATYERCVPKTEYDDVCQWKTQNENKISTKVWQDVTNKLIAMHTCDKVPSPEAEYSADFPKDMMEEKVVDSKESSDQYLVTCNRGYKLQLSEDGITYPTTSPGVPENINILKCVPTKPSTDALTKIKDAENKSVRILYETSEGCRQDPDKC